MNSLDLKKIRNVSKCFKKFFNSIELLVVLSVYPREERLRFGRIGELFLKRFDTFWIVFKSRKVFLIVS